MPRPKLITRTLTTSKITALFAKETGETQKFDFSFPGSYTKETALKKLKKFLDNEDTNGFIPVVVTDIEETEIRYGMSEEDFIANGFVISTPSSPDSTSEDNWYTLLLLSASQHSVYKRSIKWKAIQLK